MPCMDNIPNLLDAHILKVVSLTDVYWKRNMGIVKEVVLEVPSKSEQMKEALCEPKITRRDWYETSNAVRLMDSANTIIYTLMREIDGGFRRLLIHHSEATLDA